MINFGRYPHVGDLIEHYALSLKRQDILDIVQQGVSSELDAEAFSRFIWTMLRPLMKMKKKE